MSGFVIMKLKEEAFQLYSKIENLEVFLQLEQSKNLGNMHCELLRSQFNAMNIYYSILQMRIYHLTK